jgi:hypothetical protein
MNKTMSFFTRQYEFSQKYNLFLAIFYTLIGIFIAILFGIADAIVCCLSPFILINVLIAYITALGLSMTAYLLIRKAKVRNNIVNFLMTFFICLFAFYSSIWAFEVGVLEIDVMSSIQLFFSPTVVYGIMLHIIIPLREMTIAKGLGSGEIFDVLTAIIYFIIVIIFFYPAYTAFKIKGYYCEDCQVWYLYYTFFSFSDETLESNIVNCFNGNYSDVLSNTKLYFDIEQLSGQVHSPVINSKIIEYLYCQCPQCQQKSIINIKKIFLNKTSNKVATRAASNGTLVKDTYIDDKTDSLLRFLTDAWY